MKKIIILFLSAFSLMSFKVVPKIIAITGVMTYVNQVKSQNPLYLNSAINTTDVTWDVSMLYSPQGLYVLRVKDSTDLLINISNVYLKKLPAQSGGTPSNIVWANPSDGLLKTSPVSSLALSLSQVTTALGYTPSTSTLTALTSSTGISVTNGSVITNTIPDKTVAISAGTGITVTSAYPNFTISPTAIASYTTTRAINSATFQVSSTLSAWVYYTIRINCVATIGGAASGTVALQYSTNSGSTWVDVGQVENSNTVTLAIVLNSSTIGTTQLCGFIPGGAIVRMNQTSTGTTTITFVRGQENY